VANELLSFVVLISSHCSRDPRRRRRPSPAAAPALADRRLPTYNRQRLKMRQRISRNKLRSVLIWLPVRVALEFRPMSDQELAIQAVSDAQRILEEYLEPRPHDHEGLLDASSKCSSDPPSWSPEIVCSAASVNEPSPSNDNCLGKVVMADRI
jgi:hypothetical protein